MVFFPSHRENISIANLQQRKISLFSLDVLNTSLDVTVTRLLKSSPTCLLSAYKLIVPSIRPP